MDAFDVLGLTPAFDLDEGELERRYRELQKRLHPDKFVHASSSERRDSLSRAMSVNEAYRALREPLKRAELLLARHAGPALGQATVDPELLMEVMELREQLAAARKAGDLSGARALSAQVAARAEAETSVLRRSFAALAGEGSGEAVRDATRALLRLRYFQRFQDEAAAFEDEAPE